MIKKFLPLLTILAIFLLVYSLINQILAAFKSGERLSQSAEVAYSLEAKNQELRKKLTEIKSPTFIEQQARDKLGLSKKGETVVIIPEEKLRQVLGASQSARIRLPNWLGWLKLFFH